MPKRTTNVFPKTHTKYWEKRVFKKTYKTVHNGVVERRDWMVSRTLNGVRREINLRTGDRREAARRALALYLEMERIGWPASVQFKSPVGEHVECATVGDVIDRLQDYSDASARTVRDYVSTFRKVAAWIMGKRGGRGRFDYYNGGTKRWTDAVDSISLTELTPLRIQKWKKSMLASAEGDPVRERSRKISTNGDLQRLRCIFCPKHRKFMEDLKLPPVDELPGYSVPKYKVKAPPYRSTIDIERILVDGRDELRQTEPEQYKILLLAFFAGLRRDEIDKLQWSSIDFESCRVRVDMSECFAGKTPHSITQDDGILIPVEVSQELRELKEETFGVFVLEANKRKPFIATHSCYRAHHHFRLFIKWLRTKGVTAFKAIHELRKEAGSQMCEKYGIHQASVFLRHASVTTTEKHYIDTRVKNPIPLGSIFAREQKAS